MADNNSNQPPNAFPNQAIPRQPQQQGQPQAPAQGFPPQGQAGAPQMPPQQGVPGVAPQGFPQAPQSQPFPPQGQPQAGFPPQGMAPGQPVAQAPGAAPQPGGIPGQEPQAGAPASDAFGFSEDPPKDEKYNTMYLVGNLQRERNTMLYALAGVVGAAIAGGALWLFLAEAPEKKAPPAEAAPTAEVKPDESTAKPAEAPAKKP